MYGEKIAPPSFASFPINLELLEIPPEVAQYIAPPIFLAELFINVQLFKIPPLQVLNITAPPLLLAKLSINIQLFKIELPACIPIKAPALVAELFIKIQLLNVGLSFTA